MPPAKNPANASAHRELMELFIPDRAQFFEIVRAIDHDKFDVDILINSLGVPILKAAAKAILRRLKRERFDYTTIRNIYTDPGFGMEISEGALFVLLKHFPEEVLSDMWDDTPGWKMMLEWAASPRGQLRPKAQKAMMRFKPKREHLPELIQAMRSEWSAIRDLAFKLIDEKMDISELDKDILQAALKSPGHVGFAESVKYLYCKIPQGYLEPNSQRILALFED